MKITCMKIINGRFITIVINDILVIRSIEVHYCDSDNKYFLEWPTDRNEKGVKQNTFYPIETQFKEKLKKITIEFYQYAKKNPKQCIKIVLKEPCECDIGQQTLEQFQEQNENDSIYKNVTLFSVTSFRIRIIRTDNFLAIVSLIIDKTISLYNLKIRYNDQKYLQLYMPQYENKKGNKKDIIYLPNGKLRKKLEGLLIDGCKLLLSKNMKILEANVINDCINKSLNLQTVNDFECRYYKKKDILTFDEKNYLENSFKEKIYRDSKYALEQIVKDYNKEYISGRITGYVDENDYKVCLSNNTIGKIKCDKMDSYYMVIKYDNIHFEKYSFKSCNKKRSFLQLINKVFYFEIKNKESDNIFQVSIENVKRDYLEYIINYHCIVPGKIIDIQNKHACIEIPYGFIFFKHIAYLFEEDVDNSFNSSYYLGAEISVIVYLKQDKVDIIIANKRYNYIDYNCRYIFPLLLKYENSCYSRLWLKMSIEMLNRNNKFFVKNIGDLMVVNNVRKRGREEKENYRGNIVNICSESTAQRYRKLILAVGWIKDLCGYKIDKAVDYLTRNRFLYSIHYVYNKEQERDTVIIMKPSIKQDCIIPKNIIIDLTVSQGRQEKYIVQDFIGSSIIDVYENLMQHKVKMKVSYSYEKIENIFENCVISTSPQVGEKIWNDQILEVKVYKENSYPAKFAISPGEFLYTEVFSKNNGNKKYINRFNETQWTKDIVIFILKHKVVYLHHLYQWIKMKRDFEISKQDIKRELRHLNQSNMIGKVIIQDRLYRDKIQFYFPNFNLYEQYTNFRDYNGKLNLKNKKVHFYKCRAAENQAFIKIYSVLYNKYKIIYEIDSVQYFLYNTQTYHLKIHIAVCAYDDFNYKEVYFIEGIRFLENEEKIMNSSWDKMQRYDKYIDKKYEIIPKLLLVFEDEKHANLFFQRKPKNFNFRYIELFYTFDQDTFISDNDIEQIINKKNFMRKY